MQHIIVGAGPAGVIAAETLRKCDPGATIKLIGDEPEPPYSRMAIPYLLVENIDEAGTHLRKDIGHFEGLRIDVVRDRVDAVDSAARTIRLHSGATHSYDRLLICSGSTPLKPPVEGMDLVGVHNCWTLEDARHIMRHARSGSRVVLIGAGFIGSIILEALAGRDVTLSVVEMGDRMVPRMMDEIAGSMIKRWCEHKGIAVYTSTRVTGITAIKSGAEGGIKKMLSSVGLGKKKPAGETQALAVALSNGKTVEADLVICAAGVKPAIDFLDGSGIECKTGILIDQTMRTNVAEIYAAGDCAEGRDFSTGEFEVHAIQPTASEHGRVAAQNMAGIETVYEGSFNMNVLDTVGLVSCSFGLWMGAADGETASVVDDENYRYLRLQFSGEKLIGAQSIGVTQHVGVLRGLIQGEVALGEWKDKLLADPSRVMEAYLARNYTAQHAA